MAHSQGAELSTDPPSQSPKEPNSDEIFEKVFKKKPTEVKTGEVPMPVFYENSEKPLGMVQTLPGSTAMDLKIDFDSFYQQLSRVVDSPHIDKFDKDAKGEKWILLRAFEHSPYKVFYDEGKLEIRILVPAEIRKTFASSIYQFNTEYDTQPLNPSLFSAFVNFKGSEDYQAGVSSATDGRQPVRAQMDSGINLGSWVVESAVNYTENQAGLDFAPWTRGDVRLVKDYLGPTLRQTVGDLNYPVRGFQNFRSMGGISLSSQFGIQPNRLNIPTGNYDIFLKRPSRVVVFINDQQRQVLNLPAGKHRLRDFPFTSGLNDLRLDITDDLGQSETVNLSYFSSNEMLKPGVNQVNYAVGVPSTQNGFNKDYNTSLLTESFYHRIGISDGFTFGVNGQVDHTQYVVGMETMFSTPIGFLKLEPAASVLEGQPSYAIRGRYLYTDYEGPSRTQRTYGLGVEMRMPNFTVFGMTPSPNVTAYDILLTHGRAFSVSTSVNLSLSYQINRSFDPSIRNSYRVSLGLNHRWSPSINTTGTLENSTTSQGVVDTSVSFFLIWSFAKERQFVTANYNPKEDSFRATWNAMPSAPVGGTNAQVGIDSVSGTRGFDGRVQHMGLRGILSGNYRNEWVQNTSTPRQYAGVQLGTALVFAGGHLGITRPVIDSFAIISPVKSASGQPIEINPQANGNNIAASDWLGPAILPEVPSYNYMPIIVGTQKFKLGTAIDQDHFNLLPTYKSGFSIEVGTDATVGISTVLVTPDFAPITLQPGKITCLSDSSMPPVTVFTGRRGQIRAQGFKPGKYELKLFEGNWAPYIFEIPAKAEGNYEIGKVIMRPEAK